MTAPDHRADGTTLYLVSATSGDRVPGVELGDPDCPDYPGVLDQPEVTAFMDKHGYGPDAPDELMYLVTEADADEIPDGYPTLRVHI